MSAELFPISQTVIPSVTDRGPWLVMSAPGKGYCAHIALQWLASGALECLCGKRLVRIGACRHDGEPTCGRCKRAIERINLGKLIRHIPPNLIRLDCELTLSEDVCR